MIGKDQQSMLKSGRNDVTVHAHIPKYFYFRLNGKLPPGRIQFTYCTPGTSFKAYVSFKDKKPGPKNNDSEITLTSHQKSTKEIPFPFVEHGNGEKSYTSTFAYICILSHVDTAISMRIETKEPRSAYTEKVSMALMMKIN